VGPTGNTPMVRGICEPRSGDEPQATACRTIATMRLVAVRSGTSTLAIGLVALALGLLAVFLMFYFRRGFIPGDAIVYLAAGERLNAGHSLYAISAGDRPIGIQPPHWTVPLLSPPFIAVLFRPLALLPPDVGAYVWWAAALAAIGAVLLAYLRANAILASVAIMVLVVPLTYEIGVGNVNTFLLLGSVLVWRWAGERREPWAGTLTALLVMLKISPVVLAWWLVTQQRWTAVRAGVVAGLVLGAVSLLGAGLDAHIRFLEITRDTATVGVSDLSLGGIARWLGVSPALAQLLPTVMLVCGLAGVLLLRARPGLAFALAVATMTLGSPVVNINSYALLLGCLAPAMWPIRAETPGPSKAAMAVPARS
jgi:hypothetical protein